VRGRRLDVGLGVTNEDSKPMRFSIGGHPGFKVPLLPGERREDYDIVFEKPESVVRHVITAEGLRSGEKIPFLEDSDRLPIGADLFESSAIVLTGLRSRSVAIRSRVSKAFVELRFGDFPVLGLWSAPGQAPFVCIEPWKGTIPLSGADPDLAKKEGCIDLPSRSVFETSYQIELG
jgi:galactose mutarotase-like enzyme